MQNVKFLIVVLLISCYSLLIAQDVWIRGYNPFHDTNDAWAWDSYSGNNALLLNDGNYLISGSYEFGIMEYYYEHYGMLMKVDAIGDTIWTVKDSVSFLDEAENRFTLLDHDGFIYSYSTHPYFSGSFFNKRNSEGEFIWTKLLYHDNLTQYQNGCITYDNCILMGGRKFFAQGIDTLVLDKYDSDGELVWHKEYGEYEFPEVNSIIETDNYDIIFLGHHVHGHNIHVYRLTSLGEIIWTTEMEDEDDYRNYPKCVIELSNNKIMVSGEYDCTQGGWGAYLALFDLDGAYLWIKNFDNLSRINCILEDDEENVVFTSHLFTKYNYVTDEIVFENELLSDEYNNPKIAIGNRNIVKIDDGYILSGGTNLGDYLLLFKTDLNGSVETNDDVIMPVYKNLKYQNPFSESVKFEIVNNEKSQNENKIEIYNIKGQKIKTLNSNSKNITWNANSIASGIYLIRLNDDNKIYKILKVK